MALLGGVSDMIRRSEQHREAMKARREYTTHIRKLYTGSGRQRPVAQQDRELAEEDVQRVTAEIRARMARDRRRMVMLSVVLVAVAVAVGAGVIALLFWAWGA